MKHSILLMAGVLLAAASCKKDSNNPPFTGVVFKSTPIANDSLILNGDLYEFSYHGKLYAYDTIPASGGNWLVRFYFNGQVITTGVVQYGNHFDAVDFDSTNGVFQSLIYEN